MNKNNPIIESLVNYLSNVTQEQFDKDWSMLDKYNSIGPDVDHYLQQTYFKCKWLCIDDWIPQSKIDYSKIQKNPEFILDSFFITTFGF